MAAKPRLIFDVPVGMAFRLMNQFVPVFGHAQVIDPQLVIRRWGAHLKCAYPQTKAYPGQWRTWRRFYAYTKEAELWCLLNLPPTARIIKGASRA